MTRGDTFVRTIVLEKDGENYTPNSNDIIRFAMSKVYKGKSGYELLIEKIRQNSHMVDIYMIYR